MKLTHAKLMIVSGMIWFGIGLYLLQLGLRLLMAGIDGGLATTGVENTTLLLLVLALFIGYLKGRYVLGKTASRGVKRILCLPNPSPISALFDIKYCVLMAVMICLGMAIKFFGLNNDIRGFIDVAIGSALINGSMFYFRHGQKIWAIHR